MIDWPTIFSITLGGALALLGTVLSRLLEHRIESKNLKRERIQERFSGLREYLCSCMRLGVLLGGLQVFRRRHIDTPEAWEDWVGKELETQFERFYQPAMWRLHVTDAQVLKWSTELESLMMDLFNDLMAYHFHKQTIDSDKAAKRSQSINELSIAINHRLDELIDRI